ncbi:MAG: ribosome small subunit-dependent GTPase A [Thermoflavifilum sp.]|nr:ribosome small subunit-dependent GTPase A [Thermoflavifilum sp.]
MKAIIYKSTGSWYQARTADGQWITCRIKGKLKIDEDISSTNPVAVGDEVMVEQDPQTGDVLITEILPRKNYIIRSSPHRRGQKHILAANLDQAWLMATLTQPRTSTGFIDRFLVTTAAYHIPTTILINKMDLWGEEEQALADEWTALYEEMGYLVEWISVKEGIGIAELQPKLQDQTTLIAGHSGVGKSSLINLLIPGLSLRTQPVSRWSEKGMHTTTFAEMFELPFGGRIIDTPGIREFGLIDIAPEELSHYFLDMQKYLTSCMFNNCLHVNEPGCAVKAAVEEGKIHIWRYKNYLNILETLQQE